VLPSRSDAGGLRRGGARKLVYGKGPRVLYALREELGEHAFWSAVRAFTQAAVRDFSRTADLRRAFEGAAGRPLPIFDRAVYGGWAPLTPTAAIPGDFRRFG
jgi:hypothetical protein